MQTDVHPTSATTPTPRRFSFDTAAIWALIVASGLSAVAFIPSQTVPFIYTKISILAIGGLVALVFFILARLRRGNVIVPPMPLLGALWIVPVAYALSALFSGANFMTAFFGTDLESDTLGFVVLMAAIATLTALAFRRGPHYRAFFKWGAILLGLVVVAQVGFVIVGKIAPSVVTPTVNLVGTFGDLGMMIGLGITLSLLALRFLTITGKARIALYVGSALGLAILALVNSQLVWGMVALVALGLFIETIMKKRPQQDDTDFDGVSVVSGERDMDVAEGDGYAIAAPLVTLLIALFFLIGGSTIGNALVTAFNANVIDVRPSWQSTFDVGSHTYATSPIFGSGPGTFGAQWLKFRDRSLNDTIFWNVDFTSGIGYIPTAFVTTGVAGVLAWLAFLGLFLFFGIRALLFRTPSDTFMRYVSLASFTGALYVFVLSVLTVPGPVVLMTGFLMLGIFVSSLRYGRERREYGVIFARSPRIGFVIVFGLTLLLLASVVAAYVVVERYLGDLSYAKATVAYAKSDLPGATTAVNRSILFAPSERAYQLAAAIGIARMREIVANTTLTPADAQQQFQAALTGGIQAGTTATRLWPKNYQNWVMLGNVYETVVPLNIDGAYDNAKAAFTQAETLSPTNPTLPFILAQLEISKSKGPEAEAELVKAITLKHDYTQAIFLLSQLQAQEGKAKEALQAAEAAAYFAPNDPTVLFQVGILRSANGNTDGAIDALARAVQVNPQYANAHFFLGVMYATKGQLDKALTELNTVAAYSADNAKAVAADIATLQAGKNPFPPSRLGALGIPQTPVTDPTPAGAAKTTAPVQGTPAR
ncbi:MAG: Tfp pilus assembly protein PilF [Parcubacteria group bacterium]|nr:Tfp pilus assembly protein PilF [Parcubacteria group bacterium]